RLKVGCSQLLVSLGQRVSCEGPSRFLVRYSVPQRDEVAEELGEVVAGQGALHRRHRLGIEVDDDHAVIVATGVRGHSDDGEVIGLQSAETVGDLAELDGGQLGIVLNAGGEV